MLTPITIVGELVNPNGVLPSGGFGFVLTDTEGNPSTMTDSSTDETVQPQQVVGVIYQGQLLAPPQGGGPYLPLVLFATDDPTSVPSGLVYTVTEHLIAGGLPPWQLTVPHTAPGGQLNLFSQRPTP